MYFDCESQSNSSMVPMLESTPVANEECNFDIHQQLMGSEDLGESEENDNVSGCICSVASDGPKHTAVEEVITIKDQLSQLRKSMGRNTSKLHQSSAAKRQENRSASLLEPASQRSHNVVDAFWV